MIDRNIINILFNFLIFFVIFIIVLDLVFFLILRNYNGEIKGKKVELFGLLMELDNITIVSISILLIKYLFIIWSLFSKYSISIIHLVLLIIFSISFSISSRSLKNFMVELASSWLIYFSLISSKLLSNYIVDVRFTWYVFIGNILLILFILMYASFFLLRNINCEVSKNKYIRRKKNAED